MMAADTKSMTWVAMAAVAVAAFLGGYVLGGEGPAADGGAVTAGDPQVDNPAAVAGRQDDGQQVSAVRQDPPGRLLVSLDDDPSKGNPEARITMVEFSDFECPFCARFYRQTLPLIERDYVQTGLVNMVYRDMPLGFHKNAVPAHVAAECADSQGRFWEYHDILFDRQAEWAPLDPASLQAKLESFASELGLDRDFASCLESPETAREVQHDYAEAVSYGATGTPTFFIGNDQIGFVKLSGAQPYESFKAVFDRQLGA